MMERSVAAAACLLAALTQAGCQPSDGKPGLEGEAEGRSGTEARPDTAAAPEVAPSAGDFAWLQDFAERSPSGDLRWKPQPHHFDPGQVVRHIDFQDGDDNAEGSRKRPWKHHPWDSNAAGNAAAAGVEIDTFVFKGGVVYRGALKVPAPWAAEHSIKLTRDPAWGDGPAILAGSRRLAGFVKGAHKDMPDKGKVWKLDLPDIAPRSLWLVKPDGQNVRIPLARHPNWTSQPEDHKAGWFTWTNDKHPFRPANGWTANDSRNLAGRAEDFVKGAVIYSEFGWVMGTPYPTTVDGFDPANGAVQFANWTGGGNAGVIFRGMRYHLEDKPQYLDDPSGEFWFEKNGIRNAGTLYVRLPDDADPNEARLEAGFRPVLIEVTETRQLEISGLDFRWCGPYWDLTVPSWDYRTKPFGTRAEATPAAIRVRGAADHVRIANCNFEDVAKGIEMRPVKQGQAIQNVVISDNRFANCDIGAAHLSSGTGWGFSDLFGRLDNIDVFRNFAREIGFRPLRSERGSAFVFGGAERLHVAGNIVERCGAQAIDVHGGKPSGVRGEVPFIRILVHQNKAWKTMQNANDFGGIEMWQHGPAYIFNNLSHDARGQWEGRRKNTKGGVTGFGHAYYLDGGFKNYLFNNIAWGRSNDPTSPFANCSAFQEIHSYQNTFFNNTAWNYIEGTRRQSPEAGRNKFLGNVWQDMGRWVFRHNDPAGAPREANAADVGKKGDKFDYGSNAYVRNVFHGLPAGRFACYTPDGGWIADPDEFRGILEQTGSLAAEVGVVDGQPTLIDPASGDFRLASGSAAIDRGAKVFVPWALKAVVAEWNFYPAGDDPSRILDEAWLARDYLAERTDFKKQPRYPLRAVNANKDDYVEGPLENFVHGALKLDPARKTYAVLTDADLDKPFTARINTRPRHGQDPAAKNITFAGRDLRNAEIYDSSFSVEAVFKAAGDGLLIAKESGAGYRVAIEDGKAVFRVADNSGARAEIRSNRKVADGTWRHLFVEADRANRTLRIHIDGRLDAEGAGIGAGSLENRGDLFVGGTDRGEHLDATLEFLRISLGTLADADTSIEELYAWEFHGPAGRDFSGHPPKGAARDAGAIESY